LGVEALSSKSVASEDAELIAMASRFLNEIGVRSALQLRVNSLGTPQCRAKYESQALVPFFTAHRGELSEASQMKLADGRALRILDSSDAADVEVVRGAPSLMSALDAASRHRFDRVRSALGALGVEHVLDERLVRGLDYYTHTIFEFVNDDKLGRQQRTALAGGRYDGVVGALDGPKHVASFGWAAGVERLEILMQELQGDFAESSDPIVAVISARGAAVVADEDGGADDDAPIGPGEMAALQLCEQLRAQNFVVTFEHNGSVRRQLNRANKLGAVVAVIVGDDEVERGILKLRDMATGEESEIGDEFEALVEILRDRATPGELEELGSDVMMEALQAHLQAQQAQQQQGKK
jgi:histidyl-tRNA synthetase